MKGTRATKFIEESLGFLDNMYVRFILIGLLILYAAGVVPMLTPEVSMIFDNPFVKVIFLLFVVYIAFKDLPLALLLGLVYVLSLQIHYRNTAMYSMAEGGAEEGGEEGFENTEEEEEENGETESMIGAREADQGPEGYNFSDFYDCVQECGENDLNKGEMSSPCRGVGVWKDELNAQGLNCPLGNSGMKEGSPF